VLTETASGARADRGVGFRSLQEAIDTTTPGGKLVFHMFAALAEFERDLIRERTAAGLAAARARGRHGGRPSVMTTQAAGGQEMYRSGQCTVAAIARPLGSAAPPSIGTSLATAADPDRRIGVTASSSEADWLTSCMRYTDLRAYQGR
jgi:hypothetical protein